MRPPDARAAPRRPRIPVAGINDACVRQTHASPTRGRRPARLDDGARGRSSTTGHCLLRTRTQTTEEPPDPEDPAPTPQQTRLLDAGGSELGSWGATFTIAFRSLCFLREATRAAVPRLSPMAPCNAASATGGPAHFSHTWEDNSRKPLSAQETPAGHLVYIRGFHAGALQNRPWSPNGMAYIPPAPARPT